MSDSKNSLQATVEDYFSDDNATTRPRKPTTTSTRRRSHSKPPPALHKITPPDTESVDSGYSSKTAATQNSRDSTNGSRKSRPISFNAAPAASLSRPRSSSVGPAILAKSSSQSQDNSRLPSTSHIFDHSASALAMGDSYHCSRPNCECCIAQGLHTSYPPERSFDRNRLSLYPQHANPYPPQVSPTTHFPPSSYGYPPAPPLRRSPSGGPPRPRPLSYHSQTLSPAHLMQSGYPPLITTNPYSHPAIVASGPAYMSPAHPHAYTRPLPSPASPQRPLRPQITHFETERPDGTRRSSTYSSAMVAHLYGQAPPGQLAPSARHDRQRRSTSVRPMFRGVVHDDDREFMPPPPEICSSYAETSRRHSTSRPRESESRYKPVDDEYQLDRDWDPHETIKATRTEPLRSSILPDAHERYPHSHSSIPIRNGPERSGSRRKSNTGAGEVETRTSKAESYIARTSRAAKDPLTAEAVKRVNGKSVDSSSRSHRSRSHSHGHGSSEHDASSSHVSKGGTKLQIRAGEDDSWEVEGDMTGHSIRLVPQEGGGRPQMIIDGASGRETRYYKDGSKTSRTSNKSHASRAGRASKTSDTSKEGRKTSRSGREEHRNTSDQVS